LHLTNAVHLYGSVHLAFLTFPMGVDAAVIIIGIACANFATWGPTNTARSKPSDWQYPLRSSTLKGVRAWTGTAHNTINPSIATPNAGMFFISVPFPMRCIDALCQSSTLDVVALIDISMPNTPTYILYHGRGTGKDKTGKKIWTRIGAVWPNKSGKGFNLTWITSLWGTVSPLCCR